MILCSLNDILVVESMKAHFLRLFCVGIDKYQKTNTKYLTEFRKLLSVTSSTHNSFIESSQNVLENK